jgi:glucose 1-dehydrogenase
MNPDDISSRSLLRPVPGSLLAGQKALVTGASSGIGRAVAIALAEAGADVAINFLEPSEAANEVVSAIHQIGTKAMAIRADVSREDQVQVMFKQAVEELGTIDIVVNNAGIQNDAPIDRMTLEQWDSVIGTNLTGQFLCAREAIREFKRRGIVEAVSASAGKIIFMSSVHEVIPWAGRVNYAASKGGIMLLMKSIAQEVASLKIRANSICPGAIRTPLNRSAWEEREAYNELMTLIPYKRIGEPDEIGRLAVFLASDYADYITGASIFVDGGMTLYPGFETGG